MKIVDEVYPIDINTTIGPTGTIKRLFGSKSFFAENNIDMSIFAAHPIGKNILTYKYQLRQLTALPGEKDSGIMADTINARGWKNTLKSKLKELVKDNRCLSAYRINRSLKTNRALIKEYIALNRDVDIVVFHEVDSCYNYHKLMGDKAAKSAMFIHADGSDDAMMLKTYPKLAGTKTHRDSLAQFQFAIEHCSRVVFITKGAKKVFCSQHPEINPEKVVAFVNGIDNREKMSAAPSTDHKYRLCTTGSVCERKGQYLVVDAMKSLDREKLAEVHLTVIGTGPDYQMLNDRVAEAGLEQNVTFLGNVANSRIHELLSKENIYILISNNEGLPISILEAMRAGLPVISTKIAGIPEEVDARNGVLIDPDAEQLKEVLARLSEYDWNTMGKNSRERFESEFTFDIMKRNYADMINAIEL